MSRIKGYWIGHPGALLPLPDIQGDLTRKVGRAVSYNESASGRRRAYLAARRAPLREWNVTLPRLRPTEAAPLHELIMGTDPPYVWVDPWSLVTNLLTPAVVGLEGAVPTLAPLGRQPLVEGDFAATAGANPGGGVVNLPPAPVVPDLPVMVSAYVASASGGTIAAVFLDSAGGVIGTPVVSDPVVGSAALVRASLLTATPPTNAAAVSIRVTGATVIARPAVTWTSELLEFGAGGGAAQVVVSGLDEAIRWATRTAAWPRWADASFTVTEVG